MPPTYVDRLVQKKRATKKYGLKSIAKKANCIKHKALRKKICVKSIA
jgi:hypothetical protein